MAQKTIDFEKDILEPIDTLKQGLSAESDARKKDVQKLDDNKITKFYTNSQGQKVLNDSDDGKIQDLMIYGKSEQKQYKGTNLAVNSLSPISMTDRGITFTVNKDKSVTLNGTSTVDNIDYYIAGSWYNDVIATLDNEKDYTIRAMPQNVGLFYGTQNNVRICLQSDIHEKGMQITFIFIRINNSGTTFNNVTVYPQINEGTTLLDYEPYTGGKPSPSPEYPQEIKAVVNPVVKTHGKNLLNYEKWKMVGTISGTSVFENNGVTITAKYNDAYTRHDGKNAEIPVTYGKTYTLSWEEETNKQGLVYIFPNGDTNKMKHVDNDTKKILTYTVPEGVTFVTFRFGVTKAGDTISYKNIMFQEGSVSTDFRPYQETQATLPYELHAIPVESGGNVTIDGQQYIADYVDIEHGKLVRKTHATKFTGAENWQYTDPNKESSRRFGAPIQARGIPYLGLSNCATNANKVIVNKENAFVFYGAWIDVRITKFTSLVEFKNFLSEINSSGKPMTVIYALVTPEEIDLTPEAIEAFKALSTYYPKTYISAESEQLEAYTMFNYPVSMEKGWEYVKQQIGDTRKYVYDMETKLSDAEYDTAMAYVNSEYAVALTELGM